jgi:hypothetical protein
MKKLLLISFLLVSAQVFAQNSIFSKKLLDRAEKARMHDQVQSKHNTAHRSCITPILLEAWRNWDSLTPPAKKYFKAAAPGRPVLTGPEVIFHSVHFDIHYTLVGQGAVSPVDISPANGTPDYVDFMAEVFDSVYTNDVDDNYIMPPSDGFEGGSSKYDVYIDTVPQYVYGYCVPENLVGDNPNSPLIQERDAATSYMVMNNDFSWTASTPISVRVTCAHEFFHAIQFGYESYDSQFLYEATAVWMEDHRYPGLDDNLQYIPQTFFFPDIALNSDDNDGTGNYWDGIYYARWMYFKHMSSTTSDDIIRKIFENSIFYSDMTAIDQALRVPYGKNFQSDFEEYLVANFFLINDPAHPEYSYDRGSVYRNYLISNPPYEGGVKMDGTINYTGSDVTYRSMADGNGRLQRMSADYINIVAYQNCWISLLPSDPDVSIDLLIVAQDISGNFKILPSVRSANGNSYNVNDTIIAGYTGITAIVFRNDFSNSSKGSVQYQLIINDGLPEVVTSVYPNPVSDELHVNIALGSRNVSIELWDMFGKVFSDFNPSSPVYNSLDVKHIASGMYYLVIKEDNKMVLNKKIIIVR